MNLPMSAYVALTQDPPVEIDPSTGKGPEWGKAAPIGLLVILLLGIATFFLLRSMTRRLKKVPATFELPDEPPTGASSTPDIPPPPRTSPDIPPRTSPTVPPPRTSLDVPPPRDAADHAPRRPDSENSGLVDEPSG